MTTAALKDYIKHSVQQALAEDLGGSPGHDLTAQLIPENTVATATLITREDAVLCGTAWVEETFYQLDPTLELSWEAREGEQVKANQCLLRIEGKARAILTGERTAMNFLQTLSGTATVTNQYVAQLKNTNCRLLDTRKTIPGLRQAQKYAVSVGGGENHRVGLFDAYLIKENHIATAGGIKPAIELARKLNPNVKLEVEVESLEELETALKAKPDVIMLDNFTVDNMKEAVKMRDKLNVTCQLEASGDVTLERLSQIGASGVDFISVGALTKHVRATDLSLRVNLGEK